MLNAEGYKLIEKLGQGGFGEVWLAIDKNGEQVAIKFLLDNQYSENFAREVRNLNRQIDNYFVVDIYEWNLDANPPYFVMEYCKGGSLTQHCNGTKSWKDVAFVLMNVINGLHGIHKAGGFHRDIKPDNILLTFDDNNKPVFILSDMGLARIVSQSISSKMTRSPHGTDAYKAPELFIPEAKFSKECDIYSLGISMIELLTGKKKRNLIPSVKVPIKLTNLLNRMTAITPNSRPDTIAISKELKRLTEPDLPMGVISQPQQPSGLATLGGLLLGGLAVAGLIGLLAGGDEKHWDKNVGRYRGSDGKFRSG